MRMIGYTDEEQAIAERIDDIKNPRKKAEAIKRFESETGKKFPEVIFRPNLDTMFLGCTNGDRNFDKWFSSGRFRDDGTGRWR